MATGWCTGDPSRERAKAWTDGAGGWIGLPTTVVDTGGVSEACRMRSGQVDGVALGTCGVDGATLGARVFDEAARGVGEVDEAACGRGEGTTMGLESRRVSRSGGVEDPQGERLPHRRRHDGR
jgi:hypothetical protein